MRVVDAFETPEEIVAAAEFVPGELHKQFDVYKASMSGDKNSKGLPESRCVLDSDDVTVPTMVPTLGCAKAWFRVVRGFCPTLRGARRADIKIFLIGQIRPLSQETKKENQLVYMYFYFP